MSKSNHSNSPPLKPPSIIPPPGVPPPMPPILKLQEDLRARIWEFAVAEDLPIELYEVLNGEKVKVCLPANLMIRNLALTCKIIRSDLRAAETFHKVNKFRFKTGPSATRYLDSLSASKRKAMTFPLLYSKTYAATPDVRVRSDLVLDCAGCQFCTIPTPQSVSDPGSQITASASSPQDD